jgi:bacterioferritin-associated ferredoxin
MYACVCRGLTEADVRQVGSRGAVSPDLLVTVLGLDHASCCGRCLRRLDELIALADEGRDAQPSRESVASI